MVTSTSRKGRIVPLILEFYQSKTLDVVSPGTRLSPYQSNGIGGMSPKPPLAQGEDDLAAVVDRGG